MDEHHYQLTPLSSNNIFSRTFT